MNPDIQSYEKTLKEGKFRPIAMSVLASGAVQPREAIEYVCRDLGVKSVVFGASSVQNIIETKELIESYC
jgi:phosphoribosylformimino-5-aminoimidazole carboxamide ribonucleotide (ProFAR) isomerase